MLRHFVLKHLRLYGLLCSLWMAGTRVWQFTQHFAGFGRFTVPFPDSPDTLVLPRSCFEHHLGLSCFISSIKINLFDVLAGHPWVLYLFALFDLALQAHFQDRDEDPRRQKRARAWSLLFVTGWQICYWTTRDSLVGCLEDGCNELSWAFFTLALNCQNLWCPMSQDFFSQADGLEPEWNAQRLPVHGLLSVLLRVSAASQINRAGPYPNHLWSWTLDFLCFD